MKIWSPPMRTWVQVAPSQWKSWLFGPAAQTSVQPVPVTA